MSIHLNWILLREKKKKNKVGGSVKTPMSTFLKTFFGYITFLLNSFFDENEKESTSFPKTNH